MHGRALILLAWVAVLASCAPPPPREALDADRLQVQSRQLAAIAAEADLLVQQVAAGHLDRSFAWVHQQALGELAGKAASELAQPAPPSLRDAQRHALVLAGELRLVVSRIAEVQDDPAGLEALRRDLATLGMQARQAGAAAS